VTNCSENPAWQPWGVFLPHGVPATHAGGLAVGVHAPAWHVCFEGDWQQSLSVVHAAPAALHAGSQRLGACTGPPPPWQRSALPGAWQQSDSREHVSPCAWQGAPHWPKGVQTSCVGRGLSTGKTVGIGQHCELSVHAPPLSTHARQMPWASQMSPGQQWTFGAWQSMLVSSRMGQQVLVPLPQLSGVPQK
jgi:hypothetical protein